MSGMYRHRLTRDASVKRQDRFRFFFQLAAAALFNGYAAGFAQGRIFTGKTKMLCVPVLNCYSCPGALGSCPIGALQAVIGGSGHRFPFYVLGTLMLFGLVMGRLICGFLCPFGWIQDLLTRIPIKKATLPSRVDKSLRYLKYVVLVVFVLLLPAFLTDRFGVAPPYFCKFICPAGTLEGGVPLVLLNGELRHLAGGVFFWKLFLLLAILVSAVLIPRSFCRYLCPLGALYSLFNRFSLYRMELDRAKCVGCKKCEQACPMAVEVTKDINSGECIRCGRCRAACPADAISCGFLHPRNKDEIATAEKS